MKKKVHTLHFYKKYCFRVEALRLVSGEYISLYLTLFNESCTACLRLIRDASMN